MTKKQAIAKIEKTSDKYLNKDQKEVAKKIINSISYKEEVLHYFDFIMQRCDVGFKFDLTPELARGRLAIVNEMKNLNINIGTKTNKNENKLIIGDNYEALKNLLITHKEKIDIIYIDPPYNTEKAHQEGNTSAKEKTANKFIYKDKFGRNGWLNMMRERLILARKLLTNDGIIFVSIDDNEQAYLKILMDEIFEEKNFLNQINWISKKSGRQISNMPFAKTYEYILVYTKCVNDQKFNKINRIFLQKKMPFLYENKDQWIKEEKKSYLMGNSLHNTNIKKFNKNTRPNLFFPIFVNWEKKIIEIDNKNNSKDLLAIWPPKNKKNIQGVWRWSKEKIKKDKNLLFLCKNVSGKIEIKNKIYDADYTLKDTIIGSNFSTRSGNVEMENLKLEEFSNPKPTALIKLLIQVVEKKDKNSVILDFFAGSGTTGHAVLELNAQDKGKRKFILVTNNENNIGIKFTYERLYRIMKGKTTQGKTDFVWIQKNSPFFR